MFPLFLVVLNGEYLKRVEKVENDIFIAREILLFLGLDIFR